MEDGSYKCVKCDPFLKVSDDFLECLKVTCNKGKVLTNDGKCVDCGDYTIVGDDLTKCVPPECKTNDKIKTDGSCESCKDKFVSPDKKYCLVK